MEHDLSQWVGRTQESRDTITAAPLNRFAATLDTAPAAVRALAARLLAAASPGLAARFGH